MQRKKVWNGAWHYTYYVSSKERWYQHLGLPAEIEFHQYGRGYDKKCYTRHYYTYSQIEEAITAYNNRPRTRDVDILAAYGPDPGLAPFPGRHWIGAPNEREEHERQLRLFAKRTPKVEHRKKTMRKGTVYYFVEPNELVAEHLELSGSRRKSFAYDEIAAVMPEVGEEEAKALEHHIEQEMQKFDQAWEDGSHPSLVEAAKKLNRLETAERLEKERNFRMSLWGRILHDEDEDESQAPHIPHRVDAHPGWLTHIDHRDGCTYSRPESKHDPPVSGIVSPELT